MICQYYIAPSGFCQCINCQRPCAEGPRECTKDFDLRTNTIIEAGSTPESSIVTDCIRRGMEVRRADCSTCQGNTEIKVFTCAEYGECSLGAVPGIITCSKECAGYTQPPP